MKILLPTGKTCNAEACEFLEYLQYVHSYIMDIDGTVFMFPIPQHDTAINYEQEWTMKDGNNMT